MLPERYDSSGERLYPSGQSPEFIWATRTRRSEFSLILGGDRSGYGPALLTREAERVLAATEGVRHLTILGAARRSGRYVGGAEIGEVETYVRLVHAGVAIGVPRSEVEDLVRRGLAYGKRQPRRAPSNGGMLRERTDAVVRILEWWSAIALDPAFRTRRGPTTQRILAGVGLLALSAGKVRISESYRQIAEAAGLSRGTITKHQAAWLPYLRPVKHGSRKTGTATLWQLTIPRRDAPLPRGLGNNPEGHPPDISGCFLIACPPSSPSENIWHRWPGGWRVHSLLDPQEAKLPAQLAPLAGRRVDGTRRILRRLRDLGMATRTEDGWLAVEGVELPETERDWATERRERHQAERVGYRRMLAERIEAEGQLADPEPEGSLSPGRLLARISAVAGG